MKAKMTIVNTRYILRELFLNDKRGIRMVKESSLLICFFVWVVSGVLFVTAFLIQDLLYFLVYSLSRSEFMKYRVYDRERDIMLR